MEKMRRAIKNAPKRYGILSMLAAAIIIPATLFAWGPSNRPTYTYQNPADHVVFNSMTNVNADGTPVADEYRNNYGDERNFVRVKEAAAANNTYTDDFNLEPGKEYTAMVYFHNNASSDLNTPEADYKGVALDTTMRIQMPGVVKDGDKARITGFVKASNATPGEVWDEAYGTAQKGDVVLRYVQNSATIHSQGDVDGEKLPNELFTSGTKIGYDKLDGVVPGCNEFAGWVTFNFKVGQPNFEVAKMVSKAGTNQYAETVNVQPGDEVEYKIQYKNSGTIQQDTVFIIDELPEGIEYVPGSTHIANGVTQGQWARINEDTVVNRGINIGSYAPGANGFVKFKAKVAENNDLKTCGVNTLVNNAIASTDNGTRSDTATVTVEKECEEEVPAKIEVCELATKKLILIDAKLFDATKHSSNLDDCKEAPVTPVEETIEVCDVTTMTVVEIKASEFDSAMHSTDVTDCEEKPVTPETPETPASPEVPTEDKEETPVVELPKTGAGEVLTIGFGLATLVAALGYSAHSRRPLL